MLLGHNAKQNLKATSKPMLSNPKIMPPPLIPLSDLPPLKQKKILTTPLSPPGSGGSWFSPTKISWPCDQNPNIQTYSEFDDGFEPKGNFLTLKKSSSALKITRSLSETGQLKRSLSTVSPVDAANSKPSVINWNLSMAKYLLASKKPAAPKSLPTLMKKRFSFPDTSAHFSKIAPVAPKKSTKRHSIDSASTHGTKCWPINKKYAFANSSSPKSRITLLKSPDSVISPAPMSQVNFFEAALAEFDD